MVRFQLRMFHDKFLSKHLRAPHFVSQRCFAVCLSLFVPRIDFVGENEQNLVFLHVRRLRAEWTFPCVERGIQCSTRAACLVDSVVLDIKPQSVIAPNGALSDKSAIGGCFRCASLYPEAKRF